MADGVISGFSFNQNGTVTITLTVGSDVTADITTALVAFINAQGFAPLDGPIFTGAAASSTPGSGNDSTRIATTAWVRNLVTAGFIRNHLNLTQAEANSLVVNITYDDGTGVLSALQNDGTSNQIVDLDSRFALLAGATFTGHARGVAPVAGADFVTLDYFNDNSGVPVTSHALYVGWSDDTTPNDAEFTANSDTHTVTIPTSTGNRYLIVWRSDLDGGNPAEVHIAGGGNLRNTFGPAAAYTLNGVAGQVIITVLTQNSALLGGEQLRVA